MGLFIFLAPELRGASGIFHLVAANGHITKPPCLDKQVGGENFPLQMPARDYSEKRMMKTIALSASSCEALVFDGIPLLSYEGRPDISLYSKS